MVFTARLTVLGSLNMDISVTVPDLPVPGATVLGRAAVFAPGGRAPTRRWPPPGWPRRRMSVAMVGCTGDDEFGRTLRAALRAEGVDDSGVAPCRRPHRDRDDHGRPSRREHNHVVAAGANHEVSTADIAAAHRVGRSRPIEPDAASALTRPAPSATSW